MEGISLSVFVKHASQRSSEHSAHGTLSAKSMTFESRVKGAEGPPFWITRRTATIVALFVIDLRWVARAHRAHHQGPMPKVAIRHSPQRSGAGSKQQRKQGRSCGRCARGHDKTVPHRNHRVWGHQCLSRKIFNPGGYAHVESKPW